MNNLQPAWGWHPDHFLYRYKWSDEDRQYVATVDEFKSLSWLGDTPDDAVAGLKVVVGQTLKDIYNAGGGAPRPLRSPVQPQPVYHVQPQPAPSHYPTFQMPTVMQNVNVNAGGYGRRYIPTSHGFHLVMTILTCGLWAPVWLIMWIINAGRN